MPRPRNRSGATREVARRGEPGGLLADVVVEAEASWSTTTPGHGPPTGGTARWAGTSPSVMSGMGFDQHLEGSGVTELLERVAGALEREGPRSRAARSARARPRSARSRPASSRPTRARRSGRCRARRARRSRTGSSARPRARARRRSRPGGRRRTPRAIAAGPPAHRIATSIRSRRHRSPAYRREAERRRRRASRSSRRSVTTTPAAPSARRTGRRAGRSAPPRRPAPAAQPHGPAAHRVQSHRGRLDERGGARSADPPDARTRPGTPAATPSRRPCARSRSPSAARTGDGAPRGSARTRRSRSPPPPRRDRPAQNPRTPRPTSTTVPVHSWPGTIGYCASPSGSTPSSPRRSRRRCRRSRPRSGAISSSPSPGARVRPLDQLEPLPAVELDCAHTGLNNRRRNSGRLMMVTERARA